MHSINQLAFLTYRTYPLELVKSLFGENIDMQTFRRTCLCHMNALESHNSTIGIKNETATKITRLTNSIFIDWIKGPTTDIDYAYDVENKAYSINISMFNNNPEIARFSKDYIVIRKKKAWYIFNREYSTKIGDFILLKKINYPIIFENNGKQYAYNTNTILKYNVENKDILYDYDLIGINMQTKTPILKSAKLDKLL